MLYYIKLDVKEIARPADTLYNFQLYNFLPIKFISLQSIVLKVKDNLPSSPLSLYMYLIYCFSHQPNISTGGGSVLKSETYMHTKVLLAKFRIPPPLPQKMVF